MSNTRKPRNAARVADFDALRKKKQQATGSVPPVKIGGKFYTLKPTMPLSVTSYFAENSKKAEGGDVTVLLSDMQMLLAKLFGEQQWAEICEDIDITEVADLFNLVFATYGESVGEASNSGQS